MKSVLDITPLKPGSGSLLKWLIGILIGLLLLGTLILGYLLMVARPGAGAAESGSPAVSVAPSIEGPATAAAATRSAAPPARIRSVELSPPADPFQPTAAEPLAAVPTPGAAGQQAAAPGRNPAALLAPGSAVGAPQAVRQSPPAPTAPVRPQDLILTGIIDAEPALAVIKNGSQTLFLKIGDRVGDAWQLMEIKERSAVFVRDGQRVELQIIGGGAE